MILTLGSNRGALPKCKIQFSLAPKTRITSAFWRARERAGPTECASPSSTTPLPIGVANTFDSKTDL